MPGPKALTMPLIAVPIEERKPDQPLPQPQQPRRILVVDDNFDSADSLARLLKLKQHEICVAHSGPEAVHALQKFQPEIAILDLGMPGMDGFQLARQMRGSPGGDAIKLVALTGWGGPEDRERTQAAGFDHHLVKPITSEDLHAVTV